MAKSKVKGKSVVESCCAIPSPCPASLWIDLEDKQVKELKGLTVGEQGQFLISGKIVSLEQRERSDEKGETKLTGSIRVEEYSVEVLEDEENEFTKLADENDD